MAVRVSILFMCTLDLWGSAEGVTGMTQQTICLRLKRRTSMTKRDLVSHLAAFAEVWRVLILFCSGGLAYMWQWQIGYKSQSTIFHNICQSCNCYVSRSCLMLHYQRRTGIYCINSVAICKGSTPFLIGTDIFPQCLLTEFHLHYFPIEALFRR
jgi:hypothetical protein